MGRSLNATDNHRLCLLSRPSVRGTAQKFLVDLVVTLSSLLCLSLVHVAAVYVHGAARSGCSNDTAARGRREQHAQCSDGHMFQLCVPSRMFKEICSLVADFRYCILIGTIRKRTTLCAQVGNTTQAPQDTQGAQTAANQAGPSLLGPAGMPAAGMPAAGMPAVGIPAAGPVVRRVCRSFV